MRRGNEEGRRINMGYKNEDNYYQTNRLYSGQRFEYQLISDLYWKLKWDAFKMPVDYGFDVAAIPSPVAKTKSSNQDAEVFSDILFAQIKSYGFHPTNQDPIEDMVLNVSPNSKNVGNMMSTRCFYIDFEMNERIKNISKSKNVHSIIVIYLDISEIKHALYQKKVNDPTLKSVNETYMFWLTYDQLNELDKEHWLGTNPKRKKWKRLYIRFQGEYKKDKHSLEFWLHKANNKEAISIECQDNYSINQKIFEKTDYLKLENSSHDEKKNFEKYFKKVKTSNS